MNSFSSFLKNLNGYSLKAFWISLLMVFLMVALPYLGVRPQTTLFKPHVDIWQTVAPKLKHDLDNFQIKTSNSFIPTALAATQANQAKAYAVVDFNQGKLLASKDLNYSLPIASLTKLMTAVVTLDLISSADQFTISSQGAKVEPTKMGLIPGQVWGRDELLHALLLTSANDAAVELKAGIDQKYGAPIFIKAMNEKAKLLGLKNTHFTNPHGLDDPDNFSSAGDLAVLTHHALSYYPLIGEIVAKDYQFYPENSLHKQADLYNWNGLLGVYPGIKGVKIGNTDSAGVTTIVLAHRENQNIIVVLLGAPGVLERDLWAGELLDQGFAQLANITPVAVTKQQLQAKYAAWKYWN
ncbi:MAG: D-alanyl-D-alanine carboxypeptidase [Candidatus Daviesbacteria bacterium]|nr:MAG: D-alanyl-D-alanine carboxypeptidase [Candidatus Daviesbacteria bacterium]